MTLDDFFTLTEMNNGLTAPTRVRELVAVMQRERDCIVKNAADSTRQWSAVASAIVATENKECLDLFLQLDGFHFISNWLKDAQKFSNDTIDGFLEESITLLLRALEKLDADYEKLVGSEIWTTVQNLFVHNSSKVQDKARAVFESWKTKRDSNASLAVADVDKVGVLAIGEVGKTPDIERVIGCSESSMRDVLVSQETSVNTNGHELTKDDPALSTSYDADLSDKVEIANNLNKIILNPPVRDETPSDHVSSPSLPKPTMEPPLCHPVGTTFEPCSTVVPRHDTVHAPAEFHDSESCHSAKQSLVIETLSKKSGSLEESMMSKGRSFTSDSDAVEPTKAVTDPSSHKNSTAGDKSSHNEGLSCINSRIHHSDGKSAMIEGSDANQCTPTRAFIAKEGGDFNHRMLPRSSSSEKSWGIPKDSGTPLSEIKDDRKVNVIGLHRSDNGLANNYTLGRKMKNREPDRAGQKSDVEIDYGIVDPLEVARQVAIEVEREVVDHREPSCSSSEKLQEGNVAQPNSPVSVGRKQSHSGASSSQEVVNDPNLSDESSPMQEDSATSSESLDAQQLNGTRDMISQVTEAAQEEANEEKGLCNFDLNEEVYQEDPECPGNQFSTPVSVVSASRAAASGLPGAPLQFEGNLGWKGSAVTSAFRPASPRRMPESGKDSSIGEDSSSSKQRQGCLDIDLNMTGSVDGRTVDLPLDGHSQLYSKVSSGESSAEMNTKRSEHLALDLNCTSEDGGAVLDWRIGQFFPQGHCLPHSSLSSKQPIRNIDLNDQPSILNDSSVNRASQNFNVSGGNKSDETVISIMGKRVEVNRNDFVYQTPPLSNGRTPELMFDVSLGRTGNFLGIGSAVPYTHSAIYGYNNIAPAPSMPFPSTPYGSGVPIPYMVDSSGQPVIPQIMGSASTMPTTFPQPPFIVNMNRSDGVGSSRNNFDLNSGMLVESGSKESAGLGLFLNSAQVRSVDEQLRPNPESTFSSMMSRKRKEPENGWEHYPFKNYTPPWKQS